MRHEAPAGRYAGKQAGRCAPDESVVMSMESPNSSSPRRAVGMEDSRVTELT